MTSILSSPLDEAFDPADAELPEWPQRPSAMSTSAANRRGQLSLLDETIATLAKLPGLGPRSARRLTLHLLKKRELVLSPLLERLATLSAQVVACKSCGNLDAINPCRICTDPRRDPGSLCVVEDVDDLWAMERANVYRGRYLVLGGVLSALAGIGPDQLRLDALSTRIAEGEVREVIVALGATLEGQTTTHYITQNLAGTGVKVTRLAQGMPIGGELDYLDEGTLIAALNARQSV